MDFKKNIELSFRHIKKESNTIKGVISTLINDHKELKKNTHDWILFLSQENRRLKEQINHLESRMRDLQMVKNF